MAAMAPLFAWPVLLFTLPALTWLLDGDVNRANGNGWARLRAAFATGWWFGFGYFFGGLFWIGEAFLVEAEMFGWALPFAVTLMPAGLGVFYGLAATAATLAWRPGLTRLVALALAIAIAEWLRGHVLSGFPWNTLGYALTAPLMLAQSASVLGIHGLTLIVMLVLPAPLILLEDARAGRIGQSWRFAGILAALVMLTAMTSFGMLRLAAGLAPMLEGVRLRLVQPSIAQREKWRPEHQERIFFEHLALSGASPAGLAGITAVIWPEAAMPFRPLDSPEALDHVGRLLPIGVHLIAGGLRMDEEPATQSRRVYNSLLVFGVGGAPVAIYDKLHLVPFGEYLPLQPLLEAIGLRQLTKLRGGFARGAAPRALLRIPGLPTIGPLICYEAIFPGSLIQTPERPGLLVNVTNDGWFGETTGPHQHLHQTRVRAIEEGIPIARVANNGISAMIDPYGRILQRLELNVKGVIDTGVPRAITPPLYARTGDFVFLGMLAGLTVVLVVLLRRT
ncbi:MAG TPA: apolipoprotein N-acyltransferase [Hyphomicrobiaceae bacterium]|nr:apolipoprotein N-acyltransferase [Hyphomicrobiaceae bacterium]